MRPIEQIRRISAIRRELRTQFVDGSGTKTAVLARAKRFGDHAHTVSTQLRRERIEILASDRRPACIDAAAVLEEHADIGR